MPRGYHHVLSELGARDLHPGGSEATRLLLSWLPPAPSRVLEVGAGAGETSRRLAGLGHAVTALEPDPVLFRLLAAVPGIDARNEPLEAHGGLYDAAVAESVLYALPLDGAFRRLRSLLRDGGVLCFVDMVWTEAADPARVAALHDESREAFGLAVASREPLVWRDWREAAERAGFRIRDERRLGPGSPGRPTPGSFPRTARACATRPSLLLDLVRFARAARRLKLPAGWVESRACTAVAA